MPAPRARRPRPAGRPARRGCPTRSSRRGSRACRCARCWSACVIAGVLVLALVQAAVGVLPIAVCFAAMAAYRPLGRRAPARPAPPGPAARPVAGCRRQHHLRGARGHGAAGGAQPARDPRAGGAARAVPGVRRRLPAHRPVPRLASTGSRTGSATPSATGSSRACGSPARSAAPTSGTSCAPCPGFLREDARTRAELETRQSWTVNAARLAVAAPWAVLAMLSTNPRVGGRLLDPARGGRAGGRRRASRPSPTGRCCGSAGCPRTSGCCDERRWRAAGPSSASCSGSGWRWSGWACRGTGGTGLAGRVAALPARHAPAVAAARRRAGRAGGALGGRGGAGRPRPRQAGRAGHGRGRLACAAASCGPGWPPTSTGSAPSRCSGARWARSSERPLGAACSRRCGMPGWSPS